MPKTRQKKREQEQEKKIEQEQKEAEAEDFLLARRMEDGQESIQAVEGIEGYKRLIEVEEDEADELADLFSDYEVEGSQEGEGMAFNNIVGKEQKHGVEAEVEGNKRLLEVEEEEADELADLFSDFEDSQQGMSTDVEAGIFSGA